MAEAVINVWDGIRARLPRDVVSRRTAKFGALDLIVATEHLARPTDWAIEEDHHTIVVHLGGRLDHLDCEFSRGPSGAAIPSCGDVWIIPAACRYAALAQGERADFVEIHVPTDFLRDSPLAARVRHRDEFLSATAARLVELTARQGDDFADMAAHSLADAMQWHLLERYGPERVHSQTRTLSASNRARLVTRIRGGLDERHCLESLATMVGMGVRQFTRAFREAFGLSPWQYVRRARLEEAARLLASSSMSITEIGIAVGFATPSHFSAAFTQRFGVSPIRYRRRGSHTSR